MCSFTLFATLTNSTVEPFKLQYAVSKVERTKLLTNFVHLNQSRYFDNINYLKKIKQQMDAQKGNILQQFIREHAAPVWIFFPLIFKEDHAESSINIPLTKKQTSEDRDTDCTNCRTYPNSFKQLTQQFSLNDSNAKNAYLT